MKKQHQPFRCPRCGGSKFGTRLNQATKEIEGYECHSDANGQPYESTPEAAAERKTLGKRLATCGWKISFRPDLAQELDS